MNDDSAHAELAAAFYYGSFSASLHPITAADLLTIEFALEARCDPQLSGVPEAIHLTGEVFGELG